jgi:hypothetical protein
VAGEDRAGQAGERPGGQASGGQAQELPSSGWEDVLGGRTPLFYAQHSDRYARQQLIRDYEEVTSAFLIVVIDQIFPPNVTYLEELLFDCEPSKPLHVLLASPGGDGETALRMLRSMQARCSELTVIVPDLAKSAATLVCLGADRIVMGPAGDLGPVDPQFLLPNRSLVSAKEIVAAVDEAEGRVKTNPETFPLFAGLLQDVNMLMVEQARSALSRSEVLVAEALACCRGRTEVDVERLQQQLKEKLIDEPTTHMAVFGAGAARDLGLPVEEAGTSSREWAILWSLWTRYFSIGSFPAGLTSVYEGRRASHLLRPTE